MAAVSPAARAQGIAPLSAPQDTAFAEFYARHAKRVSGFCLKWLRSREEAEDAVQTTFLYAWRGLDRGVVPTFESAWVLAIARNVCLSLTDAGRRRSAEVARDPHVLEDTVAAPARSDELAVLPEALAALTEQQRRAIVMREWQGLSYQEIAAELGLSQSAVETLIFRARRSLARTLRRAPSVGSLGPWLKSLLGGGAAKLTVGVAIVAVTATASEVVTTHQGKHAVPPRHARTAPAATPAAAEPTRSTSQRPALRTTHVARSSKPADVASPAAPSAHAPTASVPAPSTAEVPTPSSARAPADLPTTAQHAAAAVSTSTSAPAGASTAPTTSTTDTATPATPATTAVGTVVDKAGDVVGAATDAAGRVTDTVTDVVGTVQGTVQQTVSTVTATLPALPVVPPVTVTVPGVPPVTVTLPALPPPPKLLP
jgi:RNA polymerase sigma-70 factor (ECF subfamily)